MKGIIPKSTLTSAQNRNGALKTVKQFGKARNFPLGLVDKFVFS